MLTDLHIELLNALLSPFTMRNLEDGKMTLAGMCVPVTYVAVRILNSRKFLGKNWRIQIGRFGENISPQNSYTDGHAWLISDDAEMLLDLTADQFEGMKRIFVGSPTDTRYLVNEDDDWDLASMAESWYPLAKSAFEACENKQRNRKI